MLKLHVILVILLATSTQSRNYSAQTIQTLLKATWNIVKRIWQPNHFYGFSSFEAKPLVLSQALIGLTSEPRTNEDVCGFGYVKSVKIAKQIGTLEVPCSCIDTLVAV